MFSKHLVYAPYLFFILICDSITSWIDTLLSIDMRLRGFGGWDSKRNSTLKKMVLLQLNHFDRPFEGFEL